MKFAFIMDPLETVKADKDTTYFLMWAAFQKGHEVHYVDQDDLFLQHNQLFGETKKLKILDRSDFPFEVQKQEIQDLSSFDIVWVRKDPPFDRRYFYTTLLLDFLPKTVRVLNRPDSLRSWNEKLGALFYEDLTPETMISSNAEELFEFVEKRRGLFSNHWTALVDEGFLF